MGLYREIQMAGEIQWRNTQKRSRKWKDGINMNLIKMDCDAGK
jgi:hypothetical protein